MSEESRYRPLIGVVAYHLAPGRVARWPEGGYGVPGTYLDALRRSDARTAILSPGEPGEADELLDPFDGLLLVGGGDVDPARYGAEPDGEHLYGVEPDRDAFEIELVHAADRLAMPTLCICRGMQVMNVAFGGSLHQHLPDLPDLLRHGVPLDGTDARHDVTPEPGSRLSAITMSGALSCLSHHHQGVDRIGEDLAVTGRSADGLVEAIERIVPDQQDETATWMVGVQWHPEETVASDPVQQSLFDALALLARLRGSRARPGQREGRGRAYHLAQPDPAWAGMFEEEAARIVAALPAELVSRIDHVGSTSVPGLPAKPIVDIQLSLTAMVPRDAYVGRLQDLGYRWVLDPWTDEHEYFSLERGGEHAGFHLHVCCSESDWETRHLAFRDWLREHPDDAAAYAALKFDLAAAHPRDIYTYVIGKTEFIRAIEARALEAKGASA